MDRIPKWENVYLKLRWIILIPPNTMSAVIAIRWSSQSCVMLKIVFDVAQGHFIDQHESCSFCATRGWVLQTCTEVDKNNFLKNIYYPDKMIIKENNKYVI